MTTNAARQVNFDAFPSDGQRPAPRPGADPLAELARIVGQDDPFRALLEARDGRVAAQPAAAPPLVQAPMTYAPVVQAPALHAPVQPTHAAYHEPVAAPAVEAPLLRGTMDAHEPAPVDAFDRYLAEVETRGPYAADPEAALPPPPTAPPRARRLLVSVGAALGIVTVAVAGGLTWRNMRTTHPVGVDGAPVVMADKAPLKVAPQNAGGTEFPGQDKQIYDRGTNKDKPTRVVNREEQPVDVAQVARQAAARDALPGTPSATNALQDSLGEPRRVRTVAVRPEMPEARPPAATATPSPIPTMTLPTGTGATAQAPAARRPAVPAMVEPTTTAAATPRVTTPAPATPPSRPQRVASASPDVAIAAPVETASAASSAFAVQLAVRPTDKEARVAFKEIQGRYSAELGGRAPIIKQAEVSGKTVYRIRVGASTMEDANGLCNKLKASGGQCFVAKN